jgi:hypothetical protein
MPSESWCLNFEVEQRLVPLRALLKSQMIRETDRSLEPKLSCWRDLCRSIGGIVDLTPADAIRALLCIVQGKQYLALCMSEAHKEWFRCVFVGFLDASEWASKRVVVDTHLRI